MFNVGELEKLQEVLTENPSSFVFARLADKYLEMDDAYRATQICEDGLKQHPHYVNGHFVYGKVLLALDEQDRAEEEFKKVLLYDSEHLGAHYYLAQITNSRGWTQNYLTELETILSIDPLFERASALLQEVQQKLQRSKEEMLEEPESFIPEQPEEEVPSPAETEPTAFPSDDQELTKLVAEHLSEPKEAEETTAPTQEESYEKPETVSAKDQAEDEKEKFDYILDEIFEDEVLTEETKTEEDLTEEDLSSAIHKKVESLDENEEESQEFFTKEEKKFLGEEKPEAEINKTVESIEKQHTSEQMEPPPEEIPPVSEEEISEEPIEEESPPEEEISEEPTIRESETYEITGEREANTAIVTPTLGEIYAAQGHYAKAIGVYEILLQKDPNNRTYKDKIAYLRDKLTEEQSKGGE